jgi:hypothetical protein
MKYHKQVKSELLPALVLVVQVSCYIFLMVHALCFVIERLD